jgi:hypothetical protein
VDNFKSESFLWVTEGGMAAARQRTGLSGIAPGNAKEEENVPDALKDDGDEEDVEGGEG